MFVIELIYKAPLAEIDAHMPAHMKFLRKYYDEADRPFRGCQPADILGIVTDYASYRGEEPRLDSESLRFAGDAYFGGRAHIENVAAAPIVEIEDRIRKYE